MEHWKETHTLILLFQSQLNEMKLFNGNKGESIDNLDHLPANDLKF